MTSSVTGLHFYFRQLFFRAFVFLERQEYATCDDLLVTE